jgi:hypothetical protein
MEAPRIEKAIHKDSQARRTSAPHHIRTPHRLPQPPTGQLRHENGLHAELRVELLERGEEGAVTDEDEDCPGSRRAT